MSFSHCPRCSSHGYEVLNTHSYCVDCNYSPDFEREEKAIPSWALKELRGNKQLDAMAQSLELAVGGRYAKSA